MKRTVVSIAAVVAGALVGISGAHAGDGYGPSSEKLIRGSVSQISLGNRDLDSSDEGTGQTIELNSTGAYNIPFWNSFSAQISSVGEYNFQLNGHDDVKRNNAVGLHLSYRNPNKGLIGIFGGYGWSKMKSGRTTSMRWP